MMKLVEHGLQITALHNHLLRAHPMPFYMHVGGQGEPVKLASAILRCLGRKWDALASGSVECTSCHRA